MDCSLPGASVRGIFQAIVLEWIAISFSSGIFPIQGSNPGFPHCGQTLYRLSHQGSLNHQGSPIKNKRIKSVFVGRLEEGNGKGKLKDPGEEAEL